MVIRQPVVSGSAERQENGRICSARSAGALSALAAQPTDVQRCCTGQHFGASRDGCRGQQLGACSTSSPVHSRSAVHGRATDHLTGCCQPMRSDSLQRGRQNDLSAHNSQTSSLPSAASAERDQRPCSHRTVASTRWRGTRRPALPPLCFAVLATLALSVAGTEINTAVSIFGPWDYELRQDGTSRCADPDRACLVSALSRMLLHYCRVQAVRTLLMAYSG